MMGNKNLRLLKVLVPVAAVCLLMYALYEYRQAAGEVDVQTRHLRESQEEYKTLTKRFDMLSRELKSAVQATADIDKQLKLEKKNRLKLESEKTELERQFETEGVRRNNENNQLSKEKQQLVEEKVELNRQLDRLNARLQTITQEMAEQGDTHAANEKKLKDECKVKLDVQTGKVTSLAGDLAECRSDQSDVRNRLEQCKEEVVSAAAKYQRSRLGGGREDHYNRERYPFSRREDNIHEDERYRGARDHYNEYPRAGQSLNDAESYNIADDAKKHGRDRRGSYRDSRRIHTSLDDHDPDALNDQGDSHHIDEKKKREIYDSLHKKLLKGEPLTDKQRRAYRLLYTIYGPKHPGSLREEGQGGVSHDSKEVSEIKDLVDYHPNEGKDKIHGRRRSYGLPSSSVPPSKGDKISEVKDLADSNPNKPASDAHLNKDSDAHNNQQAQAPPAPANNNEQEEVKDLVDGQQKLDSAKDNQKDAGAGEQKADQGAPLDDNLPKEDEEEANVEGRDPRDGAKEELEGENDNQDQPLQKPVPEGGEKVAAKEEGQRHQQPPVIDPPEPVGNGHDDDEDAGDAGDYKHDREEGEDERNRPKEPVKKQPDDVAEDPDGREAFLRDQQEFEKERVKNLEKEPRKGMAKEKQDQIKAMESELKNLDPPKRRLREMR